MKKGSKGKAKSMYEKLVGRDNLFCDSDYDEMQKAESYRIGFKLFRAQFWLLLILGLAADVVGQHLDNMAVQILSVIIMLFALVVYLIYGALTSSKGIMPKSLVKSYNPKKTAILWGLLTIADIPFFIRGGSKISVILWFFFCGYNLIMCLFVKKNERVISRQLEE